MKKVSLEDGRNIIDLLCAGKSNEEVKNQLDGKYTLHQIAAVQAHIHMGNYGPGKYGRYSGDTVKASPKAAPGLTSVVNGIRSELDGMAKKLRSLLEEVEGLRKRLS